MQRIKWLLPLALLALLAAACTLTTAAPQQTTAIPLIVVQTEEPARDEAEVFPEDDNSDPDAPTPANQPATTIPANQSSGSNSAGNNPLTCGIRTDWLTYVVQPGDTLGDLAQRTSSTVSQLVQANCLPNANSLNVGQILRVPRAPTARLPIPQTFTIGQIAQVTQSGQNLRVRTQPGTTFPVAGELFPRVCATVSGGPVAANGYTWWQIQGPSGLNGWAAEASSSEVWLSRQYTTCETINPAPQQTFNCLDPRWQFSGSSNIVSVLPALRFVDGCYQIASGISVTLSWPHAPADAIQVTFYRRSDSANRTDTIGVDNTPGDGWSVPYTVVAGIPPSGLWAESISTSQGSLRSSDLVGFFLSPAASVCSPWIATTANAPQINPTIGADGQCLQVAPGSTVTITWPGAPADATEVTFYRNNPSLPKADVMGIDSNGVDGWSITVQAVGWEPSVIFARSISAPLQGTEQESGTIGVYVRN